MRFLFLSLIIACVGCQSLKEPYSVRETCVIKDFKLTDKAQPDEFVVHVSLYASEPPSDRAILLMPPTGGTNMIDRSFARTFCKAGFDVYVLNRWTGDDEAQIDYGIHQRLYTRMLKAVDFTLTHIHSPFVGMFGTSLGGIFTAVAINHFDRIDAAFSVVGGAPIPELIVTSDQVAMVNLKKQRKEKFRPQTDEEMIAEIYRNFTLDPFKTEPKFRNKSTGVFVSTGDQTVPSQYQMALKELWQPKTVYTVSNGHFFSILRSWLYDEEFTQFFVESYQQKKSTASLL